MYINKMFKFEENMKHLITSYCVTFINLHMIKTLHVIIP